MKLDLNNQQQQKKTEPQTDFAGVNITQVRQGNLAKDESIKLNMIFKLVWSEYLQDKNNPDNTGIRLGDIPDRCVEAYSLLTIAQTKLLNHLNDEREEG